MEIFFTIVNTFLIAGAFFYQKNKNKVLTDRITEQNLLLKETKDVVLQQSTAIESQRTVVDTAIRYSEAFNPQKLEDIVRREVELEYKEEMENIRKESEQAIIEYKFVHDDKVTEIVNIAMKATSEVVGKLMPPLITAYVISLISLPSNKRHELINEIDDELTKENIKMLIAKVESKLNKELA